MRAEPEHHTEEELANAHFHTIQVKALGRLVDELYMSGAIDIEDVRKEYGKIQPESDDRVIMLDEFGPILRAVLQAGIGNHGTFEGIQR